MQQHAVQPRIGVGLEGVCIVGFRVSGISHLNGSDKGIAALVQKLARMTPRVGFWG